MLRSRRLIFNLVINIVLTFARTKRSLQCQLVYISAGAGNGLRPENDDDVAIIYLDNDTMNGIENLQTMFGCINLEIHIERQQDVALAVEITSHLGQEEAIIFGKSFVLWNLAEEIKKMGLPLLTHFQDSQGMYMFFPYILMLTLS